MRPPGFRLRTLLVLVILSGLGLGGYTLRRRSDLYRRRAAEMEWIEYEFASIRIGSSKSVAANVEQAREYWAALKRKYRRAARYPWLPVAPDPPEPSPWHVAPHWLPE